MEGGESAGVADLTFLFDAVSVAIAACFLIAVLFFAPGMLTLLGAR